MLSHVTEFTPDQLGAIGLLVEAATEPGGPTPIIWADDDEPLHDGADLAPEDMPAPWPELTAAEHDAICKRLAKWGIEIEEDETMRDENIIDIGEARDDAKRAQEGDGTRGNPFREKSAEMFKHVLNEMGVQVRRNIRARKIEFASSEDTPRRWEAANDGMLADLRERIAARFWFKARTSPDAARLRFTREALTDYLAAIGHHSKIDPFLEWLDQLPPWDNIPRIEHILSDLFGAEDDDLTRWASRAPLVGAVQRAHHPGYIIHESPVYISEEQGYGKSGLVRAFIPPEHVNQWHGDGLDLGAPQQAQSETLAGRVLVEIAELAGLRKTEIERVKTFLSRGDDGQHRGAYAYAPEAAPRMCCFIGTTNTMACLSNDSSGNRRLTPVLLAHGANVEEAAAQDREMWWAEAVAMQADGDDGRLPRRLIPQQKLRAAAHRSADEHVEDLVSSLPATPMTISEIHDAIDGRLKSAVSDQRLGAALRVSGWTVKKIRDGVKTRRLWTPPADTFRGE